MIGMDLHTLILFALTEAAMALAPGPAVMLAMSYGSRHGLRGAAMGAAGIELGGRLCPPSLLAVTDRTGIC